MRKKFVYAVEKYHTEQFVRLVYFCTDHGECALNELPSEQMKAFESLLNAKGSEGWELVQTLFGQDGVVAIWKKEKA
mgnify:FL=1